VYLNTDSQIRFDLSRHDRRIDLLRGEALFVVEHDANRPFIVSTGGASILAVGTQFNVRRRQGATDVAVVEGIVQVSELASADTTAPTQTTQTTSRGVPRQSFARILPLKLSAGEQARVSHGGVSKQADSNLSDILSWRQRRLVFRNTPLADVAAEFNRYNRVQIRLEGVAGGGMQLTGVFDADRPMALVLYAMKQEPLAVEHEGENWVIRER